MCNTGDVVFRLKEGQYKTYSVTDDTIIHIKFQNIVDPYQEFVAVKSLILIECNPYEEEEKINCKGHN